MINRQMGKTKPRVCFYYFSHTRFHLVVPEIVNSILLWQEKGYPVALYSLAAKRKNTLSDNMHAMDGVRHIQIKLPYGIIILGKFFNLGEKVLRNFQCQKQGFRANKYTISYLIESFYFCLSCYLKTDKKSDHVLIGKDPEGLLVATALKARFKENILIYWPLELWIAKDIKRLGLKIFKIIESKVNKKAFCTVARGNIQCDLLRKENDLDKDRMISIPNSPLGKGKIYRNYYFNRIFNIPVDKKIILHAGSNGPTLMTREVVATVKSWPSDCVLILHGLIGDSFKAEIERIIKNENLNVYLSLDMVPYEQIDKIFSSADIGLVFFRPDIANNTHKGLASGKLFHYIKAGLPIIVNDLIGYRGLVEGNGCGVCIKEISELGSAIRRIVQDEATYKRNAVEGFNRFRFESHHSKLIDKVERMSQE